MPWVPMVVIRSSRSSARGDLIGQHVVDVAVGEIALLFAHFDEVVDVVFEFVVNRQNVPSLSGAMQIAGTVIARRCESGRWCGHAQKRFRAGNLSARMRTQICGHPQKRSGFR